MLTLGIDVRPVPLLQETGTETSHEHVVWAKRSSLKESRLEWWQKEHWTRSPKF